MVMKNHMGIMLADETYLIEIPSVNSREVTGTVHSWTAIFPLKFFS